MIELRWGERTWGVGIINVPADHFSGDGKPLGQDVTDDPATVELCRAAFEAVWQHVLKA